MYFSGFTCSCIIYFNIVHLRNNCQSKDMYCMHFRKTSEVVFLIRFNFRGSAIGDRMIRYCDELISKII